MNCHEAKQCILADRETQLTDEVKAAFAAHLSGCPACRHLAEDLQSAVGSWRRESNHVQIPDVDLEWQKLRHSINRPNTVSRSTLIAWSAVPLAAAAVVAIGLYVVPSRPTAPNAVKSETIATAPAPTSNPETTASTIVYVDDKSGWTFVWAPSESPGRHI